MSERRICVAEIGENEWLAMIVSELLDGDGSAAPAVAAGPDPVSAFAALVAENPWLAEVGVSA